MLQNITNRASVKVAELREQCDELIQQMWNEVENSMIHYSDDEKREKASEYGIIYVYRSSELKKTELESFQQSIVFS
jgi:predicted secreted acid phosphatase